MPEKIAGVVIRRICLAGFFVAAALISGCARDSAATEIELAQRDLAQLAAAIEAFKSHYGDYPEVPVDNWGDAPAFSSQRLWAALNGRRGPRAADAELSPAGPVFSHKLDGMETALIQDGFSHTPARQYLDPWGRPYRYFYQADARDRRFTLYSAGPDGDAITGDPRGKALRRDGSFVNRDNIVFGETP